MFFAKFFKETVLAAAVAIGFAGAANATSITEFDFTGSPISQSSTSAFGDPLSATFSGFTNGVETSSVTAFGFSERFYQSSSKGKKGKSGKNVHTEYNASGVNWNSTGLGLSSDQDNGKWWHGGAVEDQNGRDFLVLELGSPDWAPIDLSFGYLSGGKNYEVFGFNGGLSAGDVAGFFASMNTFTHLAGDNAANLVFDTIENFQYLILTTRNDNKKDYFRVSGFSGDLALVSAVPVPGALPLLLTGLGIFGAARFGRRQKQTPAVA
ncbi:VPLPA-CTERM sorting domain-containing protein [Hwanghaeella sp.]|uniref:VPLPA-CTERM sorting domain-containing protein n=1 Tax=Hwanghaeella sp. TaxID=2605943 RepID=UPI003CCB910F